MKFIATLLIVLGASIAHAEKWKVTTLEWPPFTCEKCPEQGAGAKALREAMKSVGVEVEFEFLPWTRAIKEGADAKKYVGYYPSWPEDVQAGFTGSSSIFKSPIGFIEPKGKALSWNQLSDLKGKTIGSVQDYGNTKEFNKLVADGVIKTEVVPGDDINVRKVAGGRLDGAIIDINNAKWFLATDMKNLADKVQINAKVLENKDLMIALNANSKEKAKKLEEALKKVDTNKIVAEYLSKNLK